MFLTKNVYIILKDIIRFADVMIDREKKVNDMREKTLNVYINAIKIGAIIRKAG